ncbi:MAG: putative quinol monooxygenase, partial [Thermodesulfobacteriota bacterium]|nr:putative quinol monooxygenase [Thermodesulfobacteriota bacterium]
HIKAKKGLEEILRKELLALIEPTRSESNCIRYDLYHDHENKSHFMFYEHWKNKSDLEQHLQKPYIKSFMDKADELLAEPVTISLWEKVDG